MRLLLLHFLLILSISVCAQTPSASLLNKYWSARWIIPSGVPGKQYGAFCYRKTIELAEKPTQFIINVTGDNRYRLYINSIMVNEGPARSDAQHWYYATVDIAKWLQKGQNTIAAEVWNGGENAPYAQMSYRTAFLIQGNSATENILNTDKTWKVFHNKAYTPQPLDMAKLQAYMVVGDGDHVDGNLYPWGWQSGNFDDKKWPQAEEIWVGAKPRGLGSDGNWMLLPSPIPQMERFPQRLGKVCRYAGITALNEGFVNGRTPILIPAKSKVKILFDQGFLTNAYPNLTVSKGKNATIKLTYAEALINDKREKGNRNEIDGKEIVGMADVFVSGGQDRQVFQTLWFRTYRYLELEIETGEEALSIDDYIGIFTGYPLQENAYFKASDPSLDDIWKVGWRTARLCAGETYFDCPYYEQLQYTGDTRVQAFVTMYVSGDDRLIRKALTDYDHSRVHEGLTQSRYPCNDMQIIPTFSLFWVSMVHDYWMHRRDDAFVQSFLPGIESVLQWHERSLAANNMNGSLAWWNFVDWAWDWNEAERYGGVPDGSFTGSSSILSLQMAYTMRQAADLFAQFGQLDRAEHYRKQADATTAATKKICWNEERQLMSDTPDKKQFSQHANIWAVLTDAIEPAAQKALLTKVMEDKSLRQATFYFKFYLFQALKKINMGDAFLPQLKPWYDMLSVGLTTYAEQPDPTRSDCHAWSASPVYEMLSTVCGINPSSPGFRTVKIRPFLGKLKFAKGKMPHPDGDIEVQFSKSGGTGLTSTIILPQKVSGTLEWNGKIVQLRGGKQEIKVE